MNVNLKGSKSRSQLLRPETLIVVNFPCSASALRYTKTTVITPFTCVLDVHHKFRACFFLVLEHLVGFLLS
jgi:hypothetical protein